MIATGLLRLLTAPPWTRRCWACRWLWPKSTSRSAAPLRWLAMHQPPRLKYKPAIRHLFWWVWCHYSALGRCQQCDAPTWAPVTFCTELRSGRAGHYYCERCGPPLLEAALAVGEQVSG